MEVFIVATDAFFSQSDFRLGNLAGELAWQPFFGSASLESLLTCSSASGHGDSEIRGHGSGGMPIGRRVIERRKEKRKEERKEKYCATCFAQCHSNVHT